MKRMYPCASLVLLIALFSIAPTNHSFAQSADPEPITLGERVSVYSEVLKEDRPVLVYKPAGYDQNENVYPVMYLLDGDGHLLHTAGIIQFLANNNKMPPMIIIGLPNTDRTRDLTPPVKGNTNQFPTAGGADNFLSFIEDELMPFVEDNYRVAPYKLLVGHSFGGLFSVHSLITRPHLFDAHISISPSLWWDNKGLVQQADAFFEDREDLDVFMFMTLGNEGGSMLAGNWEMAGVFEEKAPEGFEWHFVRMEEETHGSIPHRSTYQGLEALYADWNLENPWKPYEENGLAGIDAHFEMLSDKFGYEIPTPEPLVNQIGYMLIQQQKPEEAITVFQRNVDSYPQSVNVYDSLGDAYNANEQYNEAMKNYEKACTMGQATNHPNVQVYCENYERVKKRLDVE